MICRILLLRRICSLSRLQTLMHMTHKKVLGQLIYNSCAIQTFLVLVLLTLDLDFGRALIPASGLFLCTVVIMVREVYFSFLRHRHLPSRQKISNAFTCCDLFPLHLNTNRAQQNCCNRLTYIPAIPCNTKKSPHTTKNSVPLLW